jgi:hypothetical protein
MFPALRGCSRRTDGRFYDLFVSSACVSKIAYAKTPWNAVACCLLDTSFRSVTVFAVRGIKWPRQQAAAPFKFGPFAGCAAINGIVKRSILPYERQRLSRRDIGH